MEQVLDVYQRPYDPDRPVICLDERPLPLIQDVRTPIAASAGQPTRTDYEYQRNGVVNVFMMFEPLAARREVRVTEWRTRADWARCIQRLVDKHYPQARKIVLVMDNLNTHTPASLYEIFDPIEANDWPISWRSVIRPNTVRG